MTVETIQVELQLLKWTEDSSNGGILRMQVDDLEPFKSMTEAKGKRAGQRFMAVLVPLADDETPEKQPVGPICRLAAIWCREEAFQNFLARTWPTLWVANSAITSQADIPAARERGAKAIILRLCEIESRRELDTNAQAKRAFNDIIRNPYMALRNGGKP